MIGMGKIKKFLFVIFTGVPGILLTMAGLNIIQFTPQTQNLILYLGLFLLAVSLVTWIIPSGSKKEVERVDEAEEGGQ